MCSWMPDYRLRLWIWIDCPLWQANVLREASRIATAAWSGNVKKPPELWMLRWNSVDSRRLPCYIEEWVSSRASYILSNHLSIFGELAQIRTWMSAEDAELRTDGKVQRKGHDGGTITSIQFGQSASWLRNVTVGMTERKGRTANRPYL